MTRGYDEIGWVVGIRGVEIDGGVPYESRVIDHAIFRTHRECKYLSSRNVLNDCLSPRRVGAADDEVALRSGRRKHAIRKFGCVRVIRIVRVTGRRRGIEVQAAQLDEECSGRIRGVGP